MHDLFCQKVGSKGYKYISPKTISLTTMTKFYQDQSDSEIREHVNYWSTLPTQNRVEIGWLFESDKEKAIKGFKKFVDKINKSKKKEEPINNA